MRLVTYLKKKTGKSKFTSEQQARNCLRGLVVRPFRNSNNHNYGTDWFIILDDVLINSSIVRHNFSQGGTILHAAKVRNNLLGNNIYLKDLEIPNKVTKEVKKILDNKREQLLQELEKFKEKELNSNYV